MSSQRRRPNLLPAHPCLPQPHASKAPARQTVRRVNPCSQPTSHPMNKSSASSCVIGRPPQDARGAGSGTMGISADSPKQLCFWMMLHGVGVGRWAATELALGNAAAW
jgi:hypothetical protein